MKKLCKSRSNVKIDGVCAGVAKYMGIDVTLVRLIWILVGFTSTGIIAYIICMLLMPRESESTIENSDYNNQYNNPN